MLDGHSTSMPAPASSSAAGPSRLVSASSSRLTTDGLACRSASVSGGPYRRAAPQRQQQVRLRLRAEPGQHGLGLAPQRGPRRRSGSDRRCCAAAAPAGTPARNHPPRPRPPRPRCRRRPWPATGRARSAARDAPRPPGRRSCRRAIPRDRRPTPDRPPRTRGDAVAIQAAGERTSRSAIASQRSRISDSGERSRIGREPGKRQGVRGRREGRGELAYPSEVGRVERPGPPDVRAIGPTVGSRRPRAIRPTPAAAAAAQTCALSRIRSPAPSLSSTGRASSSGIRSAEIRRLRMPYVPPGKTSSTLADPVPRRPSARTRLAGESHPARRPVRHPARHRTIPAALPGSPEL